MFSNAVATIYLQTSSPLGQQQGSSPASYHCDDQMSRVTSTTTSPFKANYSSQRTSGLETPEFNVVLKSRYGNTHEKKDFFSDESDVFDLFDLTNM